MPTPFEGRSGHHFPRRGPAASVYERPAGRGVDEFSRCDGAVTGLVLAALVGGFCIVFSLGLLAWLLCSAAFATIVALLPGPEPASTTTDDSGIAPTPAHGPVDAWVGERAASGEIASSCGQLARSASIDLRRRVGIEEVAAAIGRRDACRAIAAAKGRAI